MCNYTSKLRGRTPVKNSYGKIVGVIDRAFPYDDDVIRALCTVYREFINPGFAVIPTLSYEDHTLTFKHYGYNEDDIRCNRFVEIVFENLPTISRKKWKRALFYLQQTGWDLQEEDLHYILVWDWS